MVGAIVGSWRCKPWLSTKVFNFGQLAVFLLTWKIASPSCLPRVAWARFTPLRFLAYCIWLVRSTAALMPAFTSRPTHIRHCDALALRWYRRA
jgi:hypothetical protein